MEDPFCHMTGSDWKKQLNLLKKEVFRKSIHICTAFIPFFLNWARVAVIAALVVILVLYIIAEYLRQRGIRIPLISTITAAAARKRDENHFVMGPVTLAGGVLLTALIFPPLPAAIGIYALAFGDGLASLAGKIFGKRAIPLTKGKTIAGSLTCFAAIFISTYAVSHLAGRALVIAFCGMIIELLPLKDFDNLFIPIMLAAAAVLLGV